MPSVRGLVHWLFVEPKLEWFGVIAVVIAGAVIIWGPGDAEPRARIAGLVLQLFGLGTVALGFRETAKEFDRPHLESRFKEWLGRFPRPRTVQLTGISASVSLGAGALLGSVRKPLGPDATLEERLADLKAQVAEIEDRQTQLKADLSSETNQRKEAIAAEQRQREIGDEKLDVKLQTSATGGLRLSVIGLTWLIAGAILSTTSVEISHHTIDRCWALIPFAGTGADGAHTQ
jgi:hypothetical protein